MPIQKSIIKCPYKSVRLNGKTKVYVVNGKSVRLNGKKCSFKWTKRWQDKMYV